MQFPEPTRPDEREKIARAQADLDTRTQKWCDALARVIGEDAVSTGIATGLAYWTKANNTGGRLTVIEQRAEVVGSLLRRHGIDPSNF